MSLTSSLSALFAGGPAARFALIIFAAAMVLLIPLLLPELSPARVIPPAIANSAPVLLLILAGAALIAWRYPGGPTGVAGALLILAVTHVARMGHEFYPSVFTAEPALVRLGLAAAVVLGTAGALQRWPGPSSGFLILAGAAAVHVLVMFGAAAGGEQQHESSSSSSSSSTAAFPLAASAAAATVEVIQTPMRVSLQTVPPEPAPRVAPMSATLEEHMVQLRAPPNRATVNWNAPAYGAALGMGTRAALNSFKSDVSDLQQRVASASGADV